MRLSNLSENHPVPLHFQLSPQGNATQVSLPNSLLILEDEEVEILSTLESGATTDIWPIIVRVQEAEPKEHQVLYVYLSVSLSQGSSELPQAIVVDQKLEMLNPMTKSGLSSFRITPVFLAAPNSTQSSPCLICLNEVANLVSLPCGHLALGDLCIKTYFEKNDNRQCLVCRREVKELVSITDSGFDFERATEHRRILENREEGGNNPQSLDQSAVLSTVKNLMKVDHSVVSDNQPALKSPKNTPPKGKGNHEFYFPSLKNSQLLKEDQASINERKDDHDSFSRMPFALGVKKDIGAIGDLKGKVKGIFGTHTHQNSREKDGWTIDQRDLKELENTGIANNRKSEPYLASGKKKPY